MDLPSLVGREKLAVLARLAESTPQGPFVEVGVYKGGSAQVLYEVSQRQKREIYLYDTFEGIPFQGEFDSHKTGDFADASYEEVSRSLPRAVVQKGVFPNLKSIVPAKIAFAHLDVDQEKSYRDCLSVIGPRMVVGGMILCDDYCLDGAARAIDDFVKSTGVKSNPMDSRMLLLF